jgi:glycerol-3-phosphate acyltransferase PlsY
MDFILKVILAYLLGSVVGSLVVGRLRGGVDIRKLGSGNAGSTNALRTQGLAFGIWVIIIDVAKGWLAAALLPGLAIPGIDASGKPCGVAAGRVRIAAIVGHVFPMWHGFAAGGCGHAGGRLCGPRADALAPLVASWLAVVMVSGFVGLRRSPRRSRCPSIYCCVTARSHSAAGLCAGLRRARDLRTGQRATHARGHRVPCTQAVAVRRQRP